MADIKTKQKSDLKIKQINKNKLFEDNLKGNLLSIKDKANTEENSKQEYEQQKLENSIDYITNKGINAFNHYGKKSTKNIVQNTKDIKNKMARIKNLKKANKGIKGVEKTTKTQGNIVSFRTTKKAVDNAIRIFSDTSDPDEVLLKPYEYYKEKFIEVAKKLKKVVPTVEFVDTIQSEEEKKEFIVIFRELTKILIKLRIFREFKFTEEEVFISHQEYLDYKSKYLDLATGKEVQNKVSILNDIDFELEYIK